MLRSMRVKIESRGIDHVITVYPDTTRAEYISYRRINGIDGLHLWNHSAGFLADHSTTFLDACRAIASAAITVEMTEYELH